MLCYEVLFSLSWMLQVAISGYTIFEWKLSCCHQCPRLKFSCYEYTDLYLFSLHLIVQKAMIAMQLCCLKRKGRRGKT